MKKLFIAAMAMACASQMSAQTALSDELAFRIKNEAFANSQIDELAEYMTDLLGPRLAASQGKLRSEELVAKKMTEMGLSNARIERATDFNKGGWDNTKNYVAMTAPYYCSFAANPRAWSGSTKGLVKAEVVYVDALNSEADLEKYRGKMGGKIVLLPVTQTYTISFAPLATRLSDQQLLEMETDSRAAISGAAARPAYDRAAMLKLREVQNKFTAMLKSEGALAVIRTSGTFNVTSGTGVSYKIGDPEPLPEITLPLEDGGRMARLLKRGEKVEMEMDVQNVFTNNAQINNVVAEIPGTDPKLKNEVVLVGAHLDSWHGGTGGADNSSGCMVMMEALRIIKALGISPRRTIRVALWGGEEQGLYGSRGYLENNLYTYDKDKKLPGYDNFALYLNMDNGSGRFRGIYLEQNDLAVPYFKTWGKAIESLGFKTVSLRKTGSTDHVTFDQIGLPAYQFIQDRLEYSRTYHTNMDTYERLSLDDLKIDAAMVAWLALSAAQDNDRVPFKPGLPKKGTKPLY